MLLVQNSIHQRCSGVAKLISEGYPITTAYKSICTDGSHKRGNDKRYVCVISANWTCSTVGGSQQAQGGEGTRTCERSDYKSQMRGNEKRLRMWRPCTCGGQKNGRKRIRPCCTLMKQSSAYLIVKEEYINLLNSMLSKCSVGWNSIYPLANTIKRCSNKNW